MVEWRSDVIIPSSNSSGSLIITNCSPENTDILQYTFIASDNGNHGTLCKLQCNSNLSMFSYYCYYYYFSIVLWCKKITNLTIRGQTGEEDTREHYQKEETTVDGTRGTA